MRLAKGTQLQFSRSLALPERWSSWLQELRSLSTPIYSIAGVLEGIGYPMYTTQRPKDESNQIDTIYSTLSVFVFINSK
jgi:hypothetical protein